MNYATDTGRRPTAPIDVVGRTWCRVFARTALETLRWGLLTYSSDLNREVMVLRQRPKDSGRC